LSPYRTPGRIVHARLLSRALLEQVLAGLAGWTPSLTAADRSLDRARRQVPEVRRDLHVTLPGLAGRRHDREPRRAVDVEDAGLASRHDAAAGAVARLPLGGLHVAVRGQIPAAAGGRRIELPHAEPLDGARPAYPSAPPLPALRLAGQLARASAARSTRPRAERTSSSAASPAGRAQGVQGRTSGATACRRRLSSLVRALSVTRPGRA